MVKKALLILLSILCVSSCASSRGYDVAGDSIQFQEGAGFYIVVPELTEKVTYKFFGNPFDYSKRAPGRQMVDAKPDVPDEISKYLTGLGYHVELGPQLTPGSNADYSVTYQELWGWDLRPIIKMLEIEICDMNNARCASCTFEEMTFFNSQPIARSIVPRMLDELFPEDSSPP